MNAIKGIKMPLAEKYRTNISKYRPLYNTKTDFVPGATTYRIPFLNNPLSTSHEY
jgi:hypothetical protein